MNAQRFVPLSLFIVIVSLSPSGWAHRLIPDDRSHVNAESAIAIADVSVSEVAYHEADPFSPRIWFTFHAAAGQTLHLEIGVPKIERLKDFRPAYAVLGPGLPAVDLPFAIPEGYGGWVFKTDQIATPESFHEEFTGTDSWVFPVQDLTLPEAGQYYVVAYAPEADTGKLWVAIGTAESFTPDDILTLPGVIFEVRQFHEVGPIGGLAMWILLLLSVALLILILAIII
jgi:hypothetical protein